MYSYLLILKKCSQHNVILLLLMPQQNTLAYYSELRFIGLTASYEMLNLEFSSFSDKIIHKSFEFFQDKPSFFKRKTDFSPFHRCNQFLRFGRFMVTKFVDAETICGLYYKHFYHCKFCCQRRNLQLQLRTNTIELNLVVIQVRSFGTQELKL